jgi:hypothetical protein
MRLPAGGFEQFLGSSSARPLEQFEDCGGFTALACVVSRASWRFLLWGGLLTRLTLSGRDVRATCAAGRPFSCSSSPRREPFPSVLQSISYFFSLGGDYRDHMNGSGRPKTQVKFANSGGRWNGDSKRQIWYSRRRGISQSKSLRTAAESATLRATVSSVSRSRCR